MPFWASQDSLTLFQWVLRATVIFIWLFALVKIAGQRSTGHLHAFDFVIAVVIAGISAGALNSSKISLGAALISSATITLLNIGVSYLALKFSKFRRIVQDEPLILIHNGKPNQSMMHKARFNIDDLLAGLRQKNIPNIHDVEFAILEADGKLSIIPKSQARPLNAKDLNLKTEYEGMPVLLVEDGNILEDNLRRNGLEKSWLLHQMRNRGISDPKTVFLALLDTTGRLYIGNKDLNLAH